MFKNTPLNCQGLQGFPTPNIKQNDITTNHVIVLKNDAAREAVHWKLATNSF
jgi:hypothetical protein